MSKVVEAVEVFNKRRKLYKSIDFRIAAIKQEDSWYNVRTRILLSCNKPTNLIQRKIDVGIFMILFENISADNFPTLLEIIDRDEMKVDGTEIRFFADQKHDLSLENWYRKNSERAIERWGIDWPLDVFKWEVSHKFQNDMSRLLEIASERLNCYDPPYEDTYKVVREFLGLHEYLFQEHDGGRNSSCYILLPNYLAIKNCRLQGKQLDFEIKFHPSIDTSDLRLNVIAGGKTIKRRQETFNMNQIRKLGGFKLAKSSINLEDTADVQLYTFLKGRESEGPSDKRYVRNLKTTINSRFMANDVFEVSAEKLTSWLHGEGRQSSDDFEHAVSILFHVCDFSAEWLDRGNLAKDAPDILIFSSEPQALIVGECKVDVFGWKEIRKLKDRAIRLFQEIKMDTYPTMFTCIKQNDIDSETKEKARNENVTILTFEEINELLKMALRGSRPLDVLNRYFQYGLRYPLK